MKLKNKKITGLYMLEKPKTEIDKTWVAAWFGKRPKTTFRFLEDWKVRVMYNDCSSDLVIVPKGFLSDGASIPRLARLYLSRQATLMSGLLHDFLYSAASNKMYKRKKCDDVFRMALCDFDHRNRFKCFFGWAGVRIGGGSCYNTKGV